ncbi:baseplate J/gp47 family protein [Agromyces sp. NPDC056379]|uniref:baseplate J/gp47 family protein n=1 Tax=unclassified Agromyces TaxID=2639701 RepID=UPI0035E1D9B6
MSVRYDCCDDRRRELLAAPTAPAGISGIDYIEVRQGNPVSQPTEIDVVLVKPLPLPAAALTGDNIRISGGVRFGAPHVDPLVEALPGPASVERYRVVIPGGQQTDFSTYRLSIVADADQDSSHPLFDARLAAIDFGFKIDCATDLDCAEPPPSSIDAPEDDPPFDYRTRDWEGFRRLMLDRLAVLVPGFREDDPVDFTTQLVEALSYSLDHQSYRLDWISTEAFLDTARSRTSLMRHARLVDYRPAESTNARTFAAIGYSAGAFPDGEPLPARTPVLPRRADLPTVVVASRYADLIRSQNDLPVVFETLASLPLWEWRTEIALHTWGDEDCVLRRGSTSATLVDNSGGAGPLAPGDLVLLEQVRAPATGEIADADPALRQVVRLTRVTATNDLLFPSSLVDVEWGDADALVFDLVVTAHVQGPTGPPSRVVCAAARGNVVLVEHGASLPPASELGVAPSDAAALAPRLAPPRPEAGRPWRPRVSARGSLARVADTPVADRFPAAQMLAPRTHHPAVALQDPFSSWSAVPDLLASGPFARDFVVEVDGTGAPSLRFGDGVHGVMPAVGAAILVQGRFGTGPEGDIGADSLAHVVVSDARAALGIDTVTNPLPATGGTAPEPAAVVRARAPEAFRVPQRAVTVADYAWAAQRHPGVSNALAQSRWTGSWQTIILYVDRIAGRAVDGAFEKDLLAHLEFYRLAGFDVAVRAARPAPLDIELSVCADPDAIRTVVAERVRTALRPIGAGGARGFFHPDFFTFGTPLYLSRLVAAVMAVPGVQSVTPRVFQRFARMAQNELTLGVIRPSAAEVLELRDDPSFPEHGRLRLEMGGGR